MSGIIFMKTQRLDEMKRFYCDELYCRLWLDQGGCIILQSGNLLLGFCQADVSETAGMITFFFESAEQVDDVYERMSDIADAAPRVNEKYRIYQFFAHDPEGRTLEFQHFLHPLEPYLGGNELLLKRRSVREYAPENVSHEIWERLIELCRYTPSSNNSQTAYYILVSDSSVREKLAAVRGSASSPIARAPHAVAVCVDTSISGGSPHDGVIAAYHFMLSARTFGLGTCWIAAMDRPEVKTLLSVPQEHQLVTITPLGYPRAWPIPPVRKPSNVLWRW